MNRITTHFVRAFILALSLFSFSLPAISANMAFMNDTAGQYFTQQDWSLFGQNVQHTLNTQPDGKVVQWQNPKTGSGGSLMPRNTVRKNGTICRDLQMINKAKQRVDRYDFMYCKYRTGWKIQQ